MANSQTLKVLQAAFLRPVAGLGLKEDICTSLHASEIWYVFDLMQTTESELLDTPDLNLDRVTEIKDKLFGLGLGLANHPNDALVTQAAELLQEKLSRSVEDLKIPLECFYRLKGNNIHSFGDLIKCSKVELRSIHVTPRFLNEIEVELKSYNLLLFPYSIRKLVKGRKNFMTSENLILGIIFMAVLGVCGLFLFSVWGWFR